ncbi:hypothetical protein FH603_4322 [Spirosoma sp. LMG 31447]|uniref:Uncharacterized protein n=2 Tax=Spirosoma utsteinense TaxID=2585773 RepID=A0ABR6WB57_9BACT|nr:hypothetical protein [Spirosoma utsteinense]
MTLSFGDHKVGTTLNLSQFPNTFLKEIESRSEGNISSPIIEILLNNNPEFQAFPIQEYIKNFRRKLNSINFSKSKGLEFEIEFPLSWYFNEGKRPNVLWLLKNDLNGVSNTVTVYLISNKLGVTPDIIASINPLELADEIFALDNITTEYSSYNPLNFSSTRMIIDGCYGVRLEFDSKISRLGFQGEFFIVIYYVMFRDYLICISFYVPKLENEINKEDNKKFFDLIMNSLIVLDKYK